MLRVVRLMLYRVSSGTLGCSSIRTVAVVTGIVVTYFGASLKLRL